MLYSKFELDATSKSCMLQGFSGGYTMYHDTSFMICITKLYRVAWALHMDRIVGKLVISVYACYNVTLLAETT